MGLFLGTPLSWPQTRKHVDHVRDHGIQQLINVYDKFKDRKGDRLLWGDEVEYMVIKLNPKDHTARLTLRQDSILDELIVAEKAGELEALNVSFHPEYAKYMLEATPAKPYTGDFKDLLQVEENMHRRRETAVKHLEKDECILSLTVYPLLGVGKFADPWEEPTGTASRSLFLPDSIINTHVRFPTLTAHIRSRREEKVAINVPLFKDKNTPWPFHDPTIDWNRNIYPEDANAREGAAKDNHIYMDSMGFGMGSSCLQLTFQATDISEARTLYDQLIPLAPIMLALGAAAPIFRGYLSDQDVRWNVISASVDDRNAVERGEASPGSPVADGTTKHNTSPVIPKSRYDSVDCYISDNPIVKSNFDMYNDVPVVVNKRVEKKLRESGMDEELVRHFSHLFIRDPLVIFEELLDQDDDVSTDHFENIQSTNWQTLRFKPPPSGEIGWRVEFRSMDVQLTDFENAAYSVFLVLVTRVILSYNLSFYLPISKVDENMGTAHGRDAVNKGQFWFRTNIQEQAPSSDPGICQLTLNQIINGSAGFIGLVPLVKNYLVAMNVDMNTLCDLDSYLSLVSKRASGELQTAASWIRDFVMNDPYYKHDSVVSQRVNYDLLVAIKKVSAGDGWDTIAKSLLGGFSPRTGPT